MQVLELSACLTKSKAIESPRILYVGYFTYNVLKVNEVHSHCPLLPVPCLIKNIFDLIRIKSAVGARIYNEALKSATAKSTNALTLGVM